MKAFRTAYVYVRNTFAGKLAETDEGYAFTYDAEYLAKDDASAVSLTLPLREDDKQACIYEADLCCHVYGIVPAPKSAGKSDFTDRKKIGNV